MANQTKTDKIFSDMSTNIAKYLNIDPMYVSITVLAGSVILKVTVSGPIISGPEDTHVAEDLVQQFETGAMQKLMPDIPIAHVAQDVQTHFDYGFFWTKFYDSPPVNGSDSELLHMILNKHDVCQGTAPLGVNCQTSDGVPWSASGQTFAMPCGLRGIVCKDEDNQPDGCLDYKVLPPHDISFTSIPSGSFEFV